MNESRQIVVLLPLSFLLFTIGRQTTNVELPPSQSLVAWVVIALVMLLFAEFEETASLAAAFAWLLTLTIFLRYGTGAFARINKWIGET